MKELTAAEQFGVEYISDEIRKDKSHRYLLRQIEADLAVNEVQKDIMQKKEFYKRKAELIRLEYFAFMLTKKP
jgi:hypothetical protein